MCGLYDRVQEERLAHREQTGVMERLAQLVHQETRDLQVHRENVETEANLGQGDNQEKLGHRAHPESQAVMGILDYLVRVASQDQQDHLEIQCGVCRVLSTSYCSLLCCMVDYPYVTCVGCT